MSIQDFAFLVQITSEALEMIKRMISLRTNGYDDAAMRSMLAVDMRSECLFYLSLSFLREEFNKLVRANAYCGYVVDDRDNIHCICSSSWIAQFDGCKESEIEWGY